MKAAGAQVWDRIVAAQDLSDEHTISSVHFSDAVTLRIVETTAETLGVSVDEALREVGFHWTEFAIDAGYGSLFQMAGDTLPEFLSNLDRMHSSLKITLTQAVMPSFTLVSSNREGFEVLYNSPREGLDYFVLGLLQGVADHYGEPLDFTFSVRADGTLFVLRRRTSTVGLDAKPALAMAS